MLFRSAVVLVVDGAAGVGRGDAYVYAHEVAVVDAPRLCVVNKIDRLGGGRELPQLAAAADLGPFDEIVPVSAERGTGLDVLLRLLVERMPEGPVLYPDGEATDQPLEERIGEIVREQALARTREEVPHSIAVVVDDVAREGDLTRVVARIIVERDSQKGILIGARGAMMKEIGTAARRGLESLLGTRVYLDLQVTVFPGWQRDPKGLQRLGF